MIIETVERGACDICGSDERRSAGSYVMHVPGHQLSGSTWYLQRCERCGLVYVDPRPKEQIFGGFVPDTARDLSSAASWQRRLQTMERFYAPGRLLDVGVGAGAFLHYARHRGWDVHGLDVQEEFARGTSERTGIPVYASTLDDTEIQAQRFDAVTMWDVIEHVPSPRATLAAAAAVVRPGGILALSTINAASLNARLFGGSWVFWNRSGRVPEHLQAFTPDTVRLALHEAGFSMVAMHTRFAAGAIIEPAARLLALDRRLGDRWNRARRSMAGRAAGFALWRLTEFLGKPLDTVQMGDMLEVYALRIDSKLET
jgi:2-polyprenyl-3-methyl-5-hydroxy-6-metoxy-1,4-benzoquinol methylase